MKSLWFGVLLIIIAGCTADILERNQEQLPPRDQLHAEQTDQVQNNEGKPYGSEYRISMEFAETPKLNQPVDLIIALEPMFVAGQKFERHAEVAFSYWSNNEDAFDVISPYKTKRELEPYQPQFKYGYDYIIDDDLTLTDKKQTITVTIVPRKTGCYRLAVSHGYPVESGNGNMAASTGMNMDITKDRVRLGQFQGKEDDVRCPVPKEECVAGVCTQYPTTREPF